MPNISVSRVIDATIDDVWSLARPFDSIDEWHRGVSECTLEDDDPADRVGAIRNAVTPDGTFRERLVEFSDWNHTWAYTILDGPLPVEDYLGRFRLDRISSGEQTRAEWSTHFDVDLDMKSDITGDLSEALDGALKGLDEHF